MDMTNTTLYTVTEAANILGVHPNTLRKWHKSGIAKPFLLPDSKHRRFTQTEIDRLARLMQPEAQEAQA
jgi:excisionase family DNA binding protein